jgi:hypothetical protein
MLGMPFHGARQHHILDVAAHRGIILRLKGVADTLHRLLDDRPLV